MTSFLRGSWQSSSEAVWTPESAAFLGGYQAEYPMEGVHLESSFSGFSGLSSETTILVLQLMAFLQQFSHTQKYGGPRAQRLTAPRSRWPAREILLLQGYP